MKYAIEYKGLTQEQGERLVVISQQLDTEMVSSFTTYDSSDKGYKPNDPSTWKVWLGNFTLVMMGDDITAAKDKFIQEAAKITGLKPADTSKTVTKESDPVLFKSIQSGAEATAARK